MKNSDKFNPSTKEKILETALTLIRNEGFESVTIRKIASLSETNVSLVNYYFGSKERLISEAIKVLLGGFQDAFTALDDPRSDPRERLKQFLIRYAQVIGQYPDLVRKIIAMGTPVFSSQHEYGEFLQTIGFDKVRTALSEITHEEDPRLLTGMLMQIFGAIFLPLLMKPILESGTQAQVAPVEEQVELLFQHYFRD